MVLFNQRQRFLLRFQRRNLIETSGSSEDSDFDKRFESIRLMESKNPMIKFTFFGKMKRMIGTYQDAQLKSLDKKLIKGLFVRNQRDFDEDMLEQSQNKTLLMRLTNNQLERGGDSNMTLIENDVTALTE